MAIPCLWTHFSGERAGLKESEKKLLKNGFEVKMISEILGLTVEEIEKLK
ncbi:hypothetical protein [Sphingobacterium nematocida]|nr:hypothetical protein [Sphingobacterium nematocida]